MSCETNSLYVWSEEPFLALSYNGQRHDIPDTGDLSFTLEDPGLHVHAGPRQIYNYLDFDYSIDVDFELAHSEPVEQARQQADLFIPILLDESVHSATFSHNDYWLLLTKHDGTITVTSSEAKDSEIAKALCDRLTQQGIALATQDFGEDSADRVPWQDDD